MLDYNWRKIKYGSYPFAFTFGGKDMKQGLNIVTMVLGAVSAAAGIATVILSIINMGVCRKYLD